MPDLPTLGGGPSETGSVPASTTGITLTADASPNTKATTWTELIAATAYDARWVLVMVSHSLNSNTGYLIDIGVGPSTAEQVLIPNLHYHVSSTTVPNTRAYLFPLRVARGTRVSARCQASTGSSTVRLTATVISAPIGAPPGLGRVEAIGADTTDSNGVSVDCGGSAHTDVVGELTATTGFAYKWMCLEVSNPTDVATGTTTGYLVDVVTGAGGSEVPVIEDVYFVASTGHDEPTPGCVCFPVSIAAGARVAVRARCSSATAGDRVLDYIGYGVG